MKTTSLLAAQAINNEIAKSKINFDTAMLDQYANRANDDFNVPKSKIIDYISQRSSIEQASIFDIYILCYEFDTLFKTNLVETIFNSGEIRSLKQEKYPNDELKFPIKIRCLYESIRSDAFKSVPLEDTPKVFKSRKTSKIQNLQFRKGRRVYTRLRMVFKYLGIDDFFMATDLKNSGMIYYVNKKASETGVSGKDYLFANMDEINKRFNRSLRAKNFYDQYGDFLV